MKHKNSNQYAMPHIVVTIQIHNISNTHQYLSRQQLGVVRAQHRHGREVDERGYRDGNEME